MTAAGRDALLRVGVLVTVPEPLCTRLTRWRQVFTDPLADTVPPHVTLLPPLTVPASRLPLIEGHLAAIAASEPAFGITLRGTGSFRPVSPVVFAALERGVADCGRLAARVRSGPLACGLRFPYAPHVTVAHGVGDAVLDEAQRTLRGLRARFGVRCLDLYTSTDLEDPEPAGAPGERAPGHRSRWTPHARFALVPMTVDGRPRERTRVPAVLGPLAGRAPA